MASSKSSPEIGLTPKRISRVFDVRKNRIASSLPTILLALVSSALAFLPSHAGAQVNVTTFHNDIGRTGQNLNETILNTSNVTPSLFGKLFAQSVDGQMYAQPLYLSGITVNGAIHNVVFAATENDTVYAFDADSNGGTNSVPLWQASLLSTAHGAAAGATTIPSADIGSDISPQVGITGTPVIDPTTGTLYVVSAALENGIAIQRLHALNVATGAEKFGGPVVITATVAGTGSGSVNGSLTFDSLWENQRPGLLLLNGIVYVGFSSHGDNGPWHGWIIGYNAATLKQTGAYCASPNGTGSGFWSSGDGLPADQLDTVNHPYGRMFVPTGNGDYNATKPYTNAMDYGDSHLDLDLTNGVPTVTDEFTTNQQAALNSQDGDIGSGGLMVVPTQTTGTYPHLAIQAGKGGTLYVLNRDNLGGYNTATDQVLQALPYAVGNVGVWSTPAYWNGTVYYWGRFDYLKAFPLVNGVLSSKPTESVEQYGYPGATPSISANGSAQGIVWTIDSENYPTPGAAILQAHSASNVATTLYTSATNATRDAAGNAVKFVVPTVVNGKVYVGTANQLDVYGLLNGATQTQAPAFTPGSESFTGTVNVTITDATPNASIYYTTNGTAATTSSTLYTGPIAVTSTQTINAIASANGLLLSSQSSATFTNQTQAAAVVFSLPTGTYTSTQSITLSDSTPNATIYYTTNGATATTASAIYTAPIAVSATETINAIAVAQGMIASPAASATYTIQTGQTGIAFGEGFASSAGLMILNGSADLDDSRLQLTDGNQGEAGSAWYYAPINIQSFTTNFTFQLSNPNGNGITFAIQNAAANSNALGGNGYALGYAPLANSLAIKFDLYNSAGEGWDSTGLYLNGATPTVPSIDLTASGINLHSDDTMSVNLVYNGTTLNMTITDIVTAAVWSTSWTVNIPSTVGGNTAYVGFTGATGSQSASQKILSWSFVNGTGAASVATPSFSPGGGTYAAAQTVTISDATSGAAIYYTTNGSTPTNASTLYSGPVAVASTETLQAIAYSGSPSMSSSVATAAYTISQVAAMPSFSPAAGSYTTVQTVTIGDATAGATIYYTTNGTAPTTASAIYSGPITVNTTEVVNAIAVAAGYASSAVGSSAYTIGTAAPPVINYSSGFNASAMNLYGATVVNGALQLTDGGSGETRVGWYTTPVNVQSFTTDFTFQLSSASADGFTFVLQNAPAGVWAVGQPSSALGYGGIGSSVAVKFDLYNNAGEGADSTGFYLNGATPTVPSLDMTSSGVNLHSGDVMRAHLTYNGTTLALTLTDTVTGAVFTASSAINIPSTVGANTAYAGFTGTTGGATAIQNILTWTYSVGASTPSAATPTFTPAAGAYTTAQTVTIGDTTAGAAIYYTTNGTAPSTTSTLYSAPITVSATQTLNAIAVASGYNNSAVGTSAYTITTAAAAPAFSLAAGTYASAQSVTITDSTGGAKIYYTVNGTTPTAASTLYSAPIAVSATEKLQAIAVATGYNNSAVTAALYTITAPAATPTFSVAAGTYTSAQTVTIADATTGAKIYYTTNGTTPTTASTLYSAPIAVSATETVEAIAVATGYTNSAVATAGYTITLPVAATPAFSVAAGTYASVQALTISDTTTGAKIYYTTNGTTPTASSTLYTAAITVSASEIVSAIAVATGYSASAIASAAYVINVTPPVINYPNGFTAADEAVNFNLYGVSVVNNALQLSDGGSGEANIAWYQTPVNIQKFTTDFTFQLPSSGADGFTFAIQNDPAGVWALGGNGYALGFGGIQNSLAVKFDIYNNAGEGSDSTGFYLNGATPELPSVDMTASGVNLHSGDVMHAHITYNGTTLTLTLTDTVTNASFSTSSAINIPSTVGGSTATVGFTAGTGGLSAVQNILSWTYAVN